MAESWLEKCIAIANSTIIPIEAYLIYSKYLVFLDCNVDVFLIFISDVQENNIDYNVYFKNSTKLSRIYPDEFAPRISYLRNLINTYKKKLQDNEFCELSREKLLNLDPLFDTSEKEDIIVNIGNKSLDLTKVLYRETKDTNDLIAINKYYYMVLRMKSNKKLGEPYNFFNTRGEHLLKIKKVLTGDNIKFMIINQGLLACDNKRMIYIKTNQSENDSLLSLLEKHNDDVKFYGKVNINKLLELLEPDVEPEIYFKFIGRIKNNLTIFTKNKKVNIKNISGNGLDKNKIYFIPTHQFKRIVEFIKNYLNNKMIIYIYIARFKLSDIIIMEFRSSDNMVFGGIAVAKDNGGKVDENQVKAE